jgi:acyl carrier protein
MQENQELGKAIEGIVRAILGWDGEKELSYDANLFFDTGLDSLSAIQLYYGLEEKFGVELPSSVLYEYQTIASIADFINKSRRQ